MSTQDRAYATPVRIHADHAAPKRLGDWTTARAFEVRARHAEVTVGVQSGGVAQLSAITSRAYLADARRAHAESGTPTVDDPAHA